MIQVRIKRLDEATRKQYLLAAVGTRLTPSVLLGISEQLRGGPIRPPLRNARGYAAVNVGPAPPNPA